jgi:hypothetical protein
MPAMMESVKEVLPVEAAPLISVMLPRGMPPSRIASASTIPVEKSSGGGLIFGEKAAGKRFDSVASIRARRFAAVAMGSKSA